VGAPPTASWVARTPSLARRQRLQRLAKVRIRRDALGVRGRAGPVGAKEGQTAPILEVCTALISQLGVISALLQNLSTAASAGTDGSQIPQDGWRPHLSALLAHLRRTVQDTPCTHLFLLLPCLTLHHVRSQARGAGAQGGGSSTGSGVSAPGAGGGKRGVSSG